ncbi:hypothetical protein FF36_00170 [Frankia torreyi]|uniref:Uncharacterized protein n=1 Tax=Frankia torreyi TaxID=1856 RepID=A0A0D8BNF5_9ACTN|nr:MULTISPECIES: hypothetical protein [Frankia]KJE25554.1 hypothetical protein FF36_00170 [Frankia torreyi]KQM06198.1 hypothetical protein FF86_101075 [Frankia sp. CpI1-P]
MGRNKDDQRTSWGDKPGKPITSSRLTRRDLGKIVLKATVGTIALNGQNPDLEIRD